MEEHQTADATPGPRACPQVGLALCMKRCIDVLGALLVLLLGSPWLLCVAVLLAACQGLPVLFRQVRTGWRERPFTILKFRTMRTAFGADGQPLPDKERTTWIGSLLRRLSIDELPQLINVLRGEVSWVGNRPLPVEYLDRMTPEQRRRYRTIPGMTGLVDVRGRYHVSWDDQFETDTWYADNWSLWLDACIAWETAWLLLTNRDQMPADAPQREAFMGTTTDGTGGNDQ